MPIDASEIGSWWPDPLDEIPFIPAKNWWRRLWDTPEKARFRRERELARREYESEKKYHEYPKCAALLRAKHKLDFYEGRLGYVIYVDSAEASRCTCWAAKYTPEEWKEEQRKVADRMMEHVKKRRGK